MKHSIVHTLFALFLFVSPLFAQKLQKDNITESKIEEGKKYMKMRDYQTAEQCFEFAAMRPLNTLSTTAIYLSGLSSFYSQNNTNSFYRFNQILTQYPKSKYAHEAMYHLGIVHLQSTDNRYKIDGVRLLYKLRDGLQDGVPLMLTLDAGNVLKNYLFDTGNAEILEHYYPEAKPIYHKELTEAICYQKIKEGKKTEAALFYHNYISSGGIQSIFTENLLVNAQNEPTSNSGISGNNSGLKKIALMLPFFANDFEPDTLNFTPEKSRAALELYEGIEEAFEEAENELKNRYLIKVWDTNRDPVTVQAQLRELHQFRPDLIIGEIYNKQSRIISDWAESNGVPQIIPMSPAKSLVENKKETFLLNPSTVTHGRKLAEFAYRDLGLKEVLIWSDGKNSTHELASSFAYQLQIMGGTPKIITLDSVFNNNVIAQIAQNKQAMTEVQGVYIPIGNEEIAGLILSTLDAQKWKPRVLASPEMQYHEHIDTDLKARLGIYFTQNFYMEPESEEYESFLQQHIRRLNAPPTEYQIRGYDAGIFILSVMEYYANGLSLSQAIRDFVPVNGIGCSLYFDREQDNQSVYILQFRSDGITKIK